MNTITLTIEATPENLRKLADFFDEEETSISFTEAKEAMANTAKAIAKAVKQAPADPTVPEMTAPKADKTTLRELGLKLTKEGKQDVLKDALKDFGATKLSQVKEEHYEALGRRLQEALS